MLMGEEENGRDIEGFQATLYTQRKINQATQNVRMYVTTCRHRKEGTLITNQD